VIGAPAGTWHVASERIAWPQPQRRPHPALRHLLAHDYWAATGDLGTHRLLQPATTTVALVIKMRDSPHRAPAFVAGPQTRYALIDGECALSYVEVRLTPLGAFRLLGVPVSELTGHLVDVADVVGPAGPRLADRLRDAPSWPQRFAMLDRVLLGRVETGPRPAPEVTRAWHLLAASGGRTPIRAVAADVGWSHKHLIARFRTATGMPPKMAARLLRFERVVDRVTADPAVRWDRLAAEHGFADQAHLIRDFRTFMGTTPGGFRRRLAHAPVNFRQDGPAPTA
jgi:AraC-like DNA-binding protein